MSSATPGNPARPLTFGLHVRRPEREVVPEELHDERRVLVALLGQRVQLCDGVVEGGLGEAARAVRRVQDLVVKHRKVEGQAQPERYAVGLKRHFSTIGGFRYAGRHVPKMVCG